MSHHFDTPTAKEDPRINVCDLYLFAGAPGTTVMAMTVNPDAGLSAPDTFRDEGLYAFRFDVNHDAKEEVTFKFRFGDVRHADTDEHTHIQAFQVRRSTGEEAIRGEAGETLIEGETGKIGSKSGIRVYAGLARICLRATHSRCTHSWRRSITRSATTAMLFCIGKISLPNGTSPRLYSRSPVV